MFGFLKKRDERTTLVSTLQNYRNKKGLSYSQRQKIKRTITLLQEFEVIHGITYADKFPYELGCDFIHFMKLKNFMDSTIEGYWNCILVSLRRLSRSGTKTDLSCVEIPMMREDTCSVYLTVSEIESLTRLRLSGNNALVRDRFVIGCMTGMRFSDYSKITKDSIVNNEIVCKTQKTGAVVQIPIHPFVREIIDRNGGDFPREKISIQSLNESIKKLCKRAGIVEKVRWERTVGLRIVRKNIEKYKLVMSHTARRSAATNMYLAGIPTFRIMLITGHKTESSFFKYIRINKQENARVLSQHPFFSACGAVEEQENKTHETTKEKTVTDGSTR